MGSENGAGGGPSTASNDIDSKMSRSWIIGARPARMPASA